MSIFGSIMNRIFHHGAAAAPSQSQTAPSPAPQPSPAQPAPAASATAAPAAPSAPVDVEAVLAQMAAEHGGGGDYRHSIVDLLKLLDLDSSLTARKALANELGVHVGADGTAEENIALHRAVMRKLEENGGKAPDSLKGG